MAQDPNAQRRAESGEQRAESEEQRLHEGAEYASPEAEASPSVISEAVHESVRAAVQRMWDVVRKGADIIVTLRQENAILQNQLGSLRQSETVLQKRVEEFLGRIDALERQADAAQSSTPLVGGDPGANTDRLEDRIAELETMLADATTQLDETTSQLQVREDELAKVSERLGENAEITQQLAQVRIELEARTQLLQELQDAFDHRDIIVDNDEERDRLQAELDRSLKIIEKYRKAGLRHLEESELEDQMALFEPESGERRAESAAEIRVKAATLSNEELKALADRLEGVAKRLDELFGLS